MIGYYDLPNPKAVHFTDGVPWFEDYRDQPYADEWNNIKKSKLLENKTVCLVGNSVEILNYNKGEFIDSHDVVIRLGRGIPHKHSDQIGRKMDIWATGFLRMNFWDKLPPAGNCVLFC